LFCGGADQVLVRIVEGRLDRLYADARFHAADVSGRTIADVDCADESPPGHRVAVEFLFNWLEQRAGALPVLAVGHRVAYGGPRFSGPVRVGAPLLRYLAALAPLAPARQRASLRAMRAIAERWPEVPQVACFESAFHHDVPALEHALPLSSSIGTRGMRRHGDDGLSFESVIDALPAVDQRAAQGKTIVAQVGNGARLCALNHGRKIAMATGLGALDGWPGTRSRGLDPGLIRHLMAALRMGSGKVRALLRQQPELLGAAGPAGELARLVRSDEPRARFAVDLFLYRVSRELEALAAALSGLDAIVFTAGTGPHDVPIRAGICRGASALGLDLDPAANRAGGPRLSRPGSHVSAWVIPIDKRLLVARRTQTLLG
jgi:acetate kinase